jgi:uncharacterized membrane protein
MAHATVGLEVPVTRSKVGLGFMAVAWAGLIVLAVGFVWKYVFHYYLNYNAAAFDPYWPRRAGLLLHISGGTLALLTGPWQFYSGLRRKHMNVHRWTGRLFLVGVAAAATGATYLAITTTFGWAFGFGLLGLASAWVSTTGMAYYAIRKRMVEVHKEWMVRAYVVTFAFVTFRVFSDYGPTSRLQPQHDLEVTLTWACWVVPLFITELVLQLRRMRRASASA